MDDTEAIQCEPESDRISIDELAQLSPNHGKVVINTDAGKDVLSINAMIGKTNYHRNDYLVTDLGADGNMLSMGAALGIDMHKDDLVVGVYFDNSAGQGKVCFMLQDFNFIRCAGTVKHVTIFKGSRYVLS